MPQKRCSFELQLDDVVSVSFGAQSARSDSCMTFRRRPGPKRQSNPLSLLK